MTTRSLLETLGFPLPADEPFVLSAAMAEGVTKQQLHHLVRQGLLRRPLKGVYVGAHVEDTIDLRCRMLWLVVPEDAFVCDRTAAWLHGATGALAPNEDLEVPAISCFRRLERTRLRNGLVVGGRRTVRPDELMTINGIQVTTQLRTALDLGRLQPTRDLRLAGMDAMLALGVFTTEDLLGEVAMLRGLRGVRELRLLASYADGGSQSFGESALRLRWLDAGLPRPQTQVLIDRPDRIPYALDLGLPDERFAGEYDGEGPHSSPEQIEHDGRRRAWISANAGYRIEVFRKANVFGRLQDAERRLRAAWEKHLKLIGRRRYVA